MADRQSPELQIAIGVAFALFLIGTTLQVIRLYRRAKSTSAPQPAAFGSESMPMPGVGE